MQILRAFFIGLGLFGAAWISPLFAADELKLSPTQVKALGIETALLSAQDGGDVAGLPAQVVVPNNQLYVVSAPLPGLLEYMAVAANQNVQRGQLLARLQSPLLADAQRGLLQVAAQLELAHDSLARDEKLLQEGIIAESRYFASKSRHAELEAALAERRQVLRLAGMADASINKLQAGGALESAVSITAPIDGVVLEQLAGAGQRVEVAAPIYKIADLEPLWLEIQVPVGLLASLRVGLAVRAPNYPAVSGKLLSLGSNVNPLNQTVMVRAEVTRGAQVLRPGQAVEAAIAASGENGRQWSVPAAALARQAGKTLLFVQTAGGFRAQPVAVLSESAGSARVSGDLRGDERIAVRGVSNLKAQLMGVGGGE